MSTLSPNVTDLSTSNEAPLVHALPPVRTLAPVRTLSPIFPDEREPLVDVLRGAALAGILIENMAHYAGYSYDLRALSEPLGRIVALMVQFLLEAKSYSMLALLFGWGVAVSARRAKFRGISFAPIYLRRLLVLLAFGLLHGTLIWFGDILILYALLGLFLIPLLARQWSPRLILILAGGCFLFAILLTVPGDTMDAVRTWYEATTDFLRYNTHSESLYRTGTYAEITRRRIQDLLEGNSWILYYVGNVFGMFLLGFYTGRQRLFTRSSTQTSTVRKTLWISLAVGGLLNALYVATNLWPDLAPARYAYMVRVGARTIGAPVLVLFYIAATRMLLSKESWQRKLALAAHVGRMSLSNYLLQSAICTLLFYGYGLGLYGQMGPAFGLILATVIYLVQIRLSEWWFDRFWFGPAEWIWRTITYKQRQFFRIGDHTTHGILLVSRWPKVAKIGAMVLIAVAVLGSGGLLAWKTRPSNAPQAGRTAKSVAAAELGGGQPVVSSSEVREAPFVISTPQVKPVVYKPGPIASSGDLEALAGTFDARQALDRIKTLTDVPYLGRYPSSPGGKAAGDYLADQFAAYGLQPAGENGTFYQHFPIEYVALAAVPSLIVEFADGTTYDHYVLHQDYNVVLRAYSGKGEAEGQVAWANRCAREDFDRLDAVDTIVLCRDGEIELAQRNALEHGATGLLLLTDPEQRPADIGSTSREPWTPDPIPTFRVYPALVQDLLTGSEWTIQDLSSSFASYALSTRVQMRVETLGDESCLIGRGSERGCQGRNVLGVLPGRDARYADQVIVLGAHYDHLGEAPDTTAWVGANDNASGVAVLLEIARAWHEQGYVPRRTVLFAAWDAEEMGLLGSRYYVDHPRYPLDATIAKIQLDMVGAGTNTLHIDGQGSLADSILEIAANLGVDATQTHLGRSDHVPFQAAGVPASLLIWAQDGDAPPHYHRPLDLPEIIEPDKLEAAGKIASLATLALAEGEPAIQELVERRTEALQRGDLDAFMATSSSERRAADRLWFADLQNFGAVIESRVDQVRVLGNAATARVETRLETPQNPQEGGTAQTKNIPRTRDLAATVRFSHDSSGWLWAGADLQWKESPLGGNGQTNLALAHPPDVSVPDGWVSEAERRYARIGALLGLSGSGAKLLLYPNKDALQMDTMLSLSPDQDSWVGFRTAKMLYTHQITATNVLDTILCQLLLAEAGVNETTAPWLWRGLPYIVGEQLSGRALYYLDDLQAQDLVLGATQWTDATPDVAAWAAVKYLHMQMGWQGIGELITRLGQACHGDEPTAHLQEGEPVLCENPTALSVALAATLGVDDRSFEHRWRQHWRGQLDTTQAQLDAVLDARTAAALAGNEQAFLDTVDPKVPGLMADEQQWFVDLGTRPVESLELIGAPFAFHDDGSLLANVTVRYRMQDKRLATASSLVRFTPTPTGYRWAGMPFEIQSGEWVQVFYPISDDNYVSLAESLLPDIETAYAQLAAELGIERSETLYIKLYDSSTAYRTSISMNFPSSEWLSAWTNGKGAIKAYVHQTNVRQALTVQIARHLLWQTGVKTEWLLKGMSLYLADGPDGGALSEMLEASLDGTLPNLSELLPDDLVEQETDIPIIRSLALDTVDYLANTYGSDALSSFLRTHGDGSPVDEALQNAIGRSLSEFELDWADSLARGHARPEWIDIARAFDPDAAYQHIAYLADPELEGRQAGSPGDEQARTYIANHFAEYGLTPALGHDTVALQGTDGIDLYLQHFPISYTTLLDSPRLVVLGQDGRSSQTLQYRQDFVTWLGPSSRGASLSGQLVWMRDTAYQDIDLSDKIVLQQATKVWQSQADRAMAHNASGLILIGKKGSQRSILAKDAFPGTLTGGPSIPVLELTRQGADQLLEAIGLTRQNLAASPPALHTGCEVALNLPLDVPQTVQTANVLGLLPGTDPTLSQDLVIIGAHHDHVGNDPERQYSGANDNASGVGVLLEIARLWQETGYRPQRSVLFAAWGAQEPGELGATYYIEHPVFPLPHTVAVVQLDAVGGGDGYFLEAQGDPEREGHLRFVMQAAEEWMDGRLTLTRPTKRSDHSPFREIEIQPPIPGLLLTWRESSEANLPIEFADPVEPYRLGVTGKMTALALMALAQ